MPANQNHFFFLNKSFSFAYVQFLCFWHWLNFLVSIPVPQIKLCGRRRRSVMCLTGEFSPDGIWWLVVMRAHTFRMFNESFQNWQFPFLYSMESVKPNKHTKPIEILESFFFFFFHNELKMNFIDIIIGSYIIIIWFPVTWQIYVCQGRFHTYYHFSFTPVFFYYSLSKNVLPHVFIYIQLIFLSKILLFHG